MSDFELIQVKTPQQAQADTCDMYQYNKPFSGFVVSPLHSPLSLSHCRVSLTSPLLIYRTYPTCRLVS